MKGIQYEDWKVAISYFEVGAYMFTFDLNSRYYHREVATIHQCYLGFSWVDPVSKRMQFYRFTVSSTPHILSLEVKRSTHCSFLG